MKLFTKFQIINHELQDLNRAESFPILINSKPCRALTAAINLLMAEVAEHRTKVHERRTSYSDGNNRHIRDFPGCKGYMRHSVPGMVAVVYVGTPGHYEERQRIGGDLQDSRVSILFVYFGTTF